MSWSIRNRKKMDIWYNCCSRMSEADLTVWILSHIGREVFLFCIALNKKLSSVISLLMVKVGNFPCKYNAEKWQMLLNSIETTITHTLFLFYPLALSVPLYRYLSLSIALILSFSHSIFSAFSPPFVFKWHWQSIKFLSAPNGKQIAKKNQETGEKWQDTLTFCVFFFAILVTLFEFI